VINTVTAIVDLHCFEVILLIFNTWCSWRTEIKVNRLLAVALQVKNVDFTTKTVKQSLLQFRSLQFVRLKLRRKLNLRLYSFLLLQSNFII